jgi:hypothetical protein
MATYNKFNSWVEYMLGSEVDIFGTAGSTADTLKAYLSNAAPSASADLVKTDLAEITNQNGYTAPVSLANVGTRSSGTFTITATSFTVTASGAVGPFQYVAVYDDTAASDPLVCWFDYASAVTLANGETFAVLFNGVASGSPGTLFTVA